MSNLNNKDIKKVNLSQGSTVTTNEDVFTVRRRVIEEDEGGRTIMVVVLQDVESYSKEEKEMQNSNLLDRKIQHIDEGMVDKELERINKDKDSYDSDSNISPSDFSG